MIISPQEADWASLISKIFNRHRRGITIISQNAQKTLLFQAFH
jgi:hypothetical protein